MMNQIVEKISKICVMPVVVIDNSGDAVPLGEALVSGKLPVMEITFRTDAAEDAIRKLNQSSLEILLGAGTVVTREQAQRAVEAGARFIVSPGFSKVVVEWCLKNNIVVFPGVATPTEVMLALDYGLDVVKFFPCEAFGGLSTLKALSAPFSGVKFIPTGGITVDNLTNYLKLPSVLACGGSWLATRKLINQGDFAAITKLASQAIYLSHNIQ